MSQTVTQYLIVSFLVDDYTFVSHTRNTIPNLSVPSVYHK